MKTSRTTSYSIKYQFLKVVILAALPFFIVLGTSSLISYAASRNYIENQVENSTISLHNLIGLQLDHSIRSYLRSKVEAGHDLVELYLENGTVPGEELGEDDRLALIGELLSIRVGSTGYFYAVDSSGVVRFHPDTSLVGTRQDPYDPVNRQIEVREGYLEYEWRNTNEEKPRRKALYMTYIPALDWILTTTSYREEFTRMIDRAAIQKMVENVTVGRGGYSYVIDRAGTRIAHPHLSEPEASSLVSRPTYDSIVAKMFDQQDGFTSYLWRDVPSNSLRQKIVYLKYLEDFDWIVATAVYQAEITRPALMLVYLNILAAVMVAGLLSVVISSINRDIEHQLQHISSTLSIARSGDLSIRITPGGPTELQDISDSFNFFIDSLEENRTKLQQMNENLEDRVRERTEKLTRTSERLIAAEKLALTSRLVTGVAHEINTPTGVAMTAVTFQRRLLDDLIRSYSAGDLSKTELERYIARSEESVDTVIRNLSRAAELISSFKSVSSDQITLTKRRVRLRQVLDDTLISLTPELKKKRIEIALETEEIELETYPGIFVHLFVNLITNSLNHGFRDRETGSISISITRKGGLIVIDYRDDGAGIEPATRARLFEPFYTTRRSDGNIGLGLNIVRNLVIDKLQGNIEVESTPGEYSLFRITFPTEPGPPAQ